MVKFLLFQLNSIRDIGAIGASHVFHANIICLHILIQNKIFYPAKYVNMEHMIDPIFLNLSYCHWEQL